MLPSRMLVDGRTYLIEHVPKRPKWVGKDDCIGMCNVELCRIWVRNSGNIETDLRVLCHELLHALIHDAPITDSLEEALCDMLEQRLCNLLRFNDCRFFWQTRE